MYEGANQDSLESYEFQRIKGSYSEAQKCHLTVTAKGKSTDRSYGKTVAVLVTREGIRVSVSNDIISMQGHLEAYTGVC